MGLLSSLTIFLLVMIAGSRTLWKTSLMVYQLCFTPLSLRAVFQGFLLIIFFKSWKFASLKFRGLTLLFTWPISLGTANSSNVGSLQPSLPPILMSTISSLMLAVLWISWHGAKNSVAGVCVFSRMRLNFLSCADFLVKGWAYPRAQGIIQLKSISCKMCVHSISGLISFVVHIATQLNSNKIL